MKATNFDVRDLLATNDFDYPAFDILATCPDGTMRYSEQVYDTEDEAACALAKLELVDPDDLESWEIYKMPAGYAG